VSPNELNDRAKVAQQTWLSTDTATRDTWRNWYGLSDGAAIASILDPTKALPIVQSMAEAAKAGGAAVRNGLDANESRIRGYVDQGISADRSAQGFGEIGTVHDADQAIGRRFGVDLRARPRGGLPDPGAGLRAPRAGRRLRRRAGAVPGPAGRGQELPDPPHHRELLAPQDDQQPPGCKARASTHSRIDRPRACDLSPAFSRSAPPLPLGGLLACANEGCTPMPDGLDDLLDDQPADPGQGGGGQLRKQLEECSRRTRRCRSSWPRSRQRERTTSLNALFAKHASPSWPGTCSRPTPSPPTRRSRLSSRSTARSGARRRRRPRPRPPSRQPPRPLQQFVSQATQPAPVAPLSEEEYAAKFAEAKTKDEFLKMLAELSAAGA
jgi:hypothetical protein